MNSTPGITSSTEEERRKYKEFLRNLLESVYEELPEPKRKKK
jgi:hypothetical protein